jgi:hypothetical protein
MTAPHDRPRIKPHGRACAIAEGQDVPSLVIRATLARILALHADWPCTSQQAGSDT